MANIYDILLGVIGAMIALMVVAFTISPLHGIAIGLIAVAVVGMAMFHYAPKDSVIGRELQS